MSVIATTRRFLVLVLALALGGCFTQPGPTSGSAATRAPGAQTTDAEPAGPDAQPPGTDVELAGPDAESAGIDEQPAGPDAQPVAPDAESIGLDAQPVAPDAESIGLDAQPVAPDAESVGPDAEPGGTDAESAAAVCAKGASCDDGNACTTGDACDASGACLGQPVACAAPGACATAACDAASGKCQVAPLKDGTACDDGSVCTQGDACLAGSCNAGAAVGCDDGNPCTQDGCGPVVGCTHAAADGVPCDDGSACTQSDVCKGSACQPGKSSCGCQSQADCDQQDDGNLCNGSLFCDKGAMPWLCKVQVGSAVTCPAAGPCTTSACDPKTGQCVTPPLADGTLCDADGSACTPADHCLAGACVAGASLTCDDNNPCTTDACAPATGCSHAPAASACEADGSACTVDSCSQGKCVVGTAKVCNDGNPCTKDACDPTSGLCKSPDVADGAPCDDGDPCSTGDHCIGGKCGSVAKKTCNDGDVCTADSCAPGKGCVSTPVAGPCDDGSVCTQGDSCQGGACTAGAAIACDDGDTCTTDACDPAKGCTHVAIAGCAPSVSFASVDAKVVKPSCTACHGSFVYKTLLVKALPSTSPCSVKKFVVPGQPMQSLWYLKIDPTVTLPPGCGKRMPENKPALSPALVQLVKDWIAGGAKP